VKPSTIFIVIFLILLNSVFFFLFFNRGLDIVTNKVTKDEQTQVRHHVIDFLDPMEKCTVVDFRNKASSLTQRCPFTVVFSSSVVIMLCFHMSRLETRVNITEMR
jgi:hypothetical protein